MFRLVEPSSGQSTNHTEGTFSKCAHCGIPNIYRSYDNTRYNWLNEPKHVARLID